MNGAVKPFPDVETVAVYHRVSTEEQGDRRLSIDAQRAATSAIAAWRFPGARVVEFSDVGSGRNERRPGYRSLRGAVAVRTVQAIVVVDLDRLSRNAADFLQLLGDLERHRCQLFLGHQGLDTGSPWGRLVALGLVAVAEFESAMTSRRVRRVQAELRSQGKKGPGLRPFGWRVGPDRVLVEDPVEQVAIRYGLSLRAAGETWTRIAAHLNGTGTPTVSGGQWTAEGARAVLIAAGRRSAREIPAGQKT